MTTRITFNMTSDETLRIVDEYCHTHKLSRSKVIDALLSATAPVLNDINCYYQLAGKLQSRLLNGVYQRDLPHKRNVVSAEWICPYISRHLLSLNPLQARCRRYSRGER